MGPARRRLVLAYSILAAAPAILAIAALTTVSPAGTREPTSSPAGPASGASDVARVLLVIVVVVVAAHGGGVLARLLGQPRVVGQAVVGLLLGPSVLGHIVPDLYTWLHSGGSSQAIDLLSQLG